MTANTSPDQSALGKFFKRGFYFYLLMTVFVVFLFGFELGKRVSGATDVSNYDLGVTFVWACCMVYLVIDEWKMKEAYNNA